MISLLLPTVVLALALVLVASHVQARRRVLARPASTAERRYRHAQFRRRMQASSLLGLTSPAIFAGLHIRPDAWPKLHVGLWLAVLGATLWIVVLALADTAASALHYRRLGRERALARANLRGELDELAARALAGHAPARAEE